MELVIFLYQTMAFLGLGCIAIGSIVAPLLLCDASDTCAPAILWLFAPLIIGGCVSLMNLL